MRFRTSLALGAALALAAPSLVQAHFILLEPASSIEENRLGDPQKAFPCGVSEISPGAPSGAVTEARGGDTVTLKVRETIYHPGHYRVALSVLSRDELPADPETVTRESERGPISVSAAIDPDPAPPVLADGLFVHTERAAPDEIFEAQITLPNINCEKCTMQVIQWMAEHGLNREGDFTYHHCADFKITANPAAPIDTRWPGQGG
jgi:hypothetical protein